MKKFFLSLMSAFVLCGFMAHDTEAKNLTITHLKISNVTYTGQSIHHMPRVYNQNGERISRRYYSVIFDGDTLNAGVVNVHVTPRNGAMGSASGSYVIRRRSIRQCEINGLRTFKSGESFDYHQLQISYRGMDVSYRVSGYKNTIGRHYLTIYGLGNFKGKVKRRYKIVA